MITKEEYKELDSKIEKLNQKLNAIYTILSQMNGTEEKKPSQTNSRVRFSERKLFPKNQINFEDLLLVTETNLKSNNLVRNILQNTYPTITQGQYEVLYNIAEQNNVELTK